MRNSIRASLCAVLVSLLAACGGGGGGGGGGGFPIFPGTGNPATPTTSPGNPAQPPATPVTGAAIISGKVTANGAPVANATVRAGAQTVTTDAQGSYRLEFAAPATSAVVLVKSAGHLTMAKQAALAPGQTTTQDIALQPVDVQRTFLAADGVIAIVNGAVIDIPKDAIKDASGGAYDGAVQLVASYRNPTTVAGVDAFPQPYQGEAEGTTVNLQTVGVIEATLATPDGQPLQLRAQATLVYPGVSAIDRGVATIPLWHYDEARGLWVREGEAARQSDGSYLGKVSHFSTWNLDQQWGGTYTGITINFCVNFQNGAAARHGIKVYVEGNGFFASFDVSPLQAGSHSFINVPAYNALNVRFFDQGNNTTQTQAIPATSPGASVTLPACLSLMGTEDYVPPPPPPPPVPVPADTPVNALQGSLVTGAWTSWSSDGGEYGWIASLSADASGAIIGEGGIYPAEEQMGSLTGQMAVGGYFTLTATRIPGGSAPPNGPILFSGRVFVDPDNSNARSVQGVWSYVSPPGGVSTPPNAIFMSSPPV